MSHILELQKFCRSAQGLHYSVLIGSPIKSFKKQISELAAHAEVIFSWILIDHCRNPQTQWNSYERHFLYSKTRFINGWSWLLWIFKTSHLSNTVCRYVCLYLEEEERKIRLLSQLWIKQLLSVALWFLMERLQIQVSQLFPLLNSHC